MDCGDFFPTSVAVFRHKAKGESSCTVLETLTSFCVVDHPGSTNHNLPEAKEVRLHEEDVSAA